MIHFVSYGDIRYQWSKRRIAHEAAAMGFDTIRILGPESLPADFVRSTAPHIHAHRGAGYWLWKPYLLERTLDGIADGDLLLYADAGCHLNARARHRLADYVAQADRAGGIASFALCGFPEERYTTEAVFDHFAVRPDDPIRSSDQRSCTFVLARKTPLTIGVFERFYQTALARPDLFSDLHSTDPRNGPGFVAHRHDQSIFSILCKRAGVPALPDESWARDWSAAHVPIQARRWRQRHRLHEWRDRCRDAVGSFVHRLGRA